MRTININVTFVNGTTETMTALASAINEVRRDLDSDPNVAKWEVEC